MRDRKYENGYQNKMAKAQDNIVTI